MKKRIWEKRIFSFVTVLALCLCLLPGKLTVNAADISVSNGNELETAISVGNNPILTRDITVNTETGKPAEENMYTISKSITITGQSTGQGATTKPVLTIPHMGLSLEADVVLKNLTINLTNRNLQGIFTNGHKLTLDNVNFTYRTTVYTKTLTINKTVENEDADGNVTTTTTTTKSTMSSGNGEVVVKDAPVSMNLTEISAGDITVDILPNPDKDAAESTVVQVNRPVFADALVGIVRYDNSNSEIARFTLNHIKNLYVDQGTLSPANIVNGVDDYLNVSIDSKAALNLYDVMNANGHAFTFDTLVGTGGNGDDGSASGIQGTSQNAKWTERMIMLGNTDVLTVKTRISADCFVLRIVGPSGGAEAPTTAGSTAHKLIVAPTTQYDATSEIFALDPACNTTQLIAMTKTDYDWVVYSPVQDARMECTPTNWAQSGWAQTVNLYVSDPYLISFNRTQIMDLNKESKQTGVAVANDMNGYCIYYIKNSDTNTVYIKTARVKRDNTDPEFKAEPDSTNNSVVINFINPDKEMSPINRYEVLYGSKPMRFTVGKNDEGKDVLYISGLTFHESYTLTIFAYDEAGNEGKDTAELYTGVVTGGDLASATVVITNVGTPIYNGKEFKPIVSVTMNQGPVTPDKYTVTWSRSNGSAYDTTSAGTLTATVTAVAGSGFTGTNSASFTIQPANVDAEALPTAGAISFGQQLSESELLNGPVIVIDDTILKNDVVPGTWSWVDANSRPFGSRQYAARFTPNDPNYATITRDVSVTINEVEPVVNLSAPSSQIAGQKVTVSLTATNPNYTSLGGPPYTLSYQIGNGNVQAMDSTGTFTIPANTPADTKITVIATTSAVAGQYLTKEVRAEITVVNKTQVRIRDVDPDDAMYDGKPHVGYVGEPMVRRGYEGDFVIQYAGRDGTTYNSNVPPTNAGDYTVTFSVPESDPTYAGSLALEFTIEKRPVTVKPRSLTVKLGSKAPTLELEFDNIADGENDLTPSAAPVFEITAEDSTITELNDVPARDGVYDVTWRNLNASTFRNSNNYEITKRGSGTITVKETVGWEILRKGSRYYTDVDEYLTGWQEMNNRQYYFDEAGYMATGWYQDEDMNWYLFSETGVMQTGWKQVGGRWYHMKGNGAMNTGWYYDNSDGCYYFLNRGTGAMQTGWIRDSSGAWYYCNSAGIMQTGWTSVGGIWYNLRGDGSMRTGWYNDGRNWYYLGSNGAMRTGWNQIGGSWYYLGSDGRMYVNTRTPDGYRVNASGQMIGR